MKNIKLRIVYLILGSALLLFALFMLAVMVNGLRTEGNFFCQREHEMREEAVFTGVNAFREFQIVF